MAGRSRDRGDDEVTSPADFRLDWPSGGRPPRSVPDTDLRLDWGSSGDERPDAVAPAVEHEAEAVTSAAPAEPAPEPMTPPTRPPIRLRARGSSAGTTVDHEKCRREIGRLEAEVEALRAEISALRAPGSTDSSRGAGRLRGRR